MNILIIHRKKGDPVEDFANLIKEKLEKDGNHVDMLSREDDLNMPNLSSSMGSLKEFVIKKDSENNYDRIYTFDWSLAFPLLIPHKVLKDKHFCFFYDIETSGGRSEILQKISGNIMKDHLFVRTDELKNKFPKAKLYKDED